MGRLVVAVFGGGWVGMVAAVCWSADHEVFVVEADPQRFDALAKGWLPAEPGLAEAREGRTIRFVSSPEEISVEVDVAVLASGTPADDDGNLNLQFLRRDVDMVAAMVAKKIERSTDPQLVDPASTRWANPDPLLVLQKSTVPPGTAQLIDLEIMLHLNRVLEPGWDKVVPQTMFAVASNPEFLREGTAVLDFRRPDRIVVGYTGPARLSWAQRHVQSLYWDQINFNSTDLIEIDAVSAELGKLAANTMLAARLSLVNEIAYLCETSFGASWASVAEVIGSDARIGHHFLAAGPGWGGSCFPKDAAQLALYQRDLSEEGVGSDSILHAIQGSNFRTIATFASVASILATTQGGKGRVGVIGLGFKPGVADFRDSPVVASCIALALGIGSASPSEVLAWDPSFGTEGWQTAMQRASIRPVDGWAWENGQLLVRAGEDDSTPFALVQDPATLWDCDVLVVGNIASTDFGMLEAQLDLQWESQKMNRPRPIIVFANHPNHQRLLVDLGLKGYRFHIRGEAAPSWLMSAIRDLELSGEGS